MKIWIALLTALVCMGAAQSAQAGKKWVISNKSGYNFKYWKTDKDHVKIDSIPGTVANGDTGEVHFQQSGDSSDTHTITIYYYVENYTSETDDPNCYIKMEYNHQSSDVGGGSTTCNVHASPDTINGSYTACNDDNNWEYDFSEISGSGQCTN